METPAGWLTDLQQWMTYAAYCIEQPMQAPVCRPFWTWAMIAVFIIGALLSIVVVWKIVSYKLKLAAALKAERGAELGWGQGLQRRARRRRSRAAHTGGGGAASRREPAVSRAYPS